MPPRALDPKKDLAVYGYGTVAWKERMQEWKKKQNERLQVVKHERGSDGQEPDDPDLPMYVFFQCVIFLFLFLHVQICRRLLGIHHGIFCLV